MRKIICLLVMAMLVSGCFPGTYMWYGAKRSDSMAIAKKNNENMAKLNIGMPKEKVIEIMGTPDKTEAYTIDNKPMEFLFYRTQGCDENLNDIDANFTPIAIEKDIVVGWGRNFYDQTIKFKSDIKQDITIKK